MEINIDKKNPKASKTGEDIKQSLLAQISTGKVILFTGAGFSTGTTNIIENSPVVAKDLASCRVYKQSVIHLCEFEHIGA